MSWDITKWLLSILIIIIGVITKDYIKDTRRIYDYGFIIGVIVEAIIHI